MVQSPFKNCPHAHSAVTSFSRERIQMVVSAVRGGNGQVTVSGEWHEPQLRHDQPLRIGGVKTLLFMLRFYHN